MRPVPNFHKVMLFSQERIITFHCISSNQTAKENMFNIHTDQSKERYQSLLILSSPPLKTQMSTWQVSIDHEAQESVKQSCTHSAPHSALMEQRWFSSHRWCSVRSCHIMHLVFMSLTGVHAAPWSGRGWTVCWSDKIQSYMLKTDLLVRNRKLKVRETENHSEGKVTVITCFTTFSYQFYSCAFRFKYWWFYHSHL